MNSHEYSTKRRHKNMQTSFTYTHLVKIQPIKLIPNEYSEFALIPETGTLEKGSNKKMHQNSNKILKH